MWNILLKYEEQHNKVYTSSVRGLMPIIQHPLYNAISQKPLQEAGGKHKILQLLPQFDDNLRTNYNYSVMTIY